MSSMTGVAMAITSFWARVREDNASRRNGRQPGSHVRIEAGHAALPGEENGGIK